MNIKLLLTLLIAITLNNGLAQTTNKPKTQMGKILAWDNIYFGMPRDTVENLIQESSNPNVYIVGDYECRIYCYYNSANLLNKISLITVPLSLASYETGLQMWYDEIVKTLTEEFGKPTSNRGYPDISKLKHGKTELSTIWNLKAKTIQMGMGRNYNDGFVSIFIFKNPTK